MSFDTKSFKTGNEVVSENSKDLPDGLKNIENELELNPCTAGNLAGIRCLFTAELLQRMNTALI